ncbi:site-specific recombinase XerD [Paraburkholderia terricola]|uniref:tyrosine-type recombinase/integrase n=1 Tax=Paraburkholderia terricola TaxID=169427 RepID=UPI00285C27E6|nr:tyrosine-type recombinase/integrase [Paraburkholderia terricola]MDR6493184.1 site-specific recombinase XerD [Paraburkholderia terricola]
MRRSTKRFAAELICPRKCFADFSEVWQAAGLPRDEGLRPRLFELPLIAVVLDSDGLPLWTPTFFLADTALASRAVTGDTVRTYAEALIPWLQYLAERKIALECATEETIGVYRADISHLNRSQTNTRYASATVNQRIIVPANFHFWGQRRGMMPSPLGEYLCERESLTRRSRVDSRRGFRSSKLPRIAAPRVIRRLPVALSDTEIQRLFSATPMPYRLMLRWCVACGLRRFEVCGLRISDLPTSEQIANSNDGVLTIVLLRKGGREVSVYVPAKLVTETHWYILTERPAPASSEQTFVFLNKTGRQVSRQILTKTFRKSADLLGSKATLHHLRHTFAVAVLGILTRHADEGEDFNSLKVLQVLLGHASIETSEIYIQAAQTSSDAVIEALDFLYGASL